MDEVGSAAAFRQDAQTMDERSHRNPDELEIGPLGLSAQANAEGGSITENDDRALEESPEIDDPGEGFEADLDSIFEKNAELFRRHTL